MYLCIAHERCRPDNSPGLLLAALMLLEAVALVALLEEPPPLPPKPKADAAADAGRGWRAAAAFAREVGGELWSAEVGACFLTIFTFNATIGVDEARAPFLISAPPSYTPAPY